MDADELLRPQEARQDSPVYVHATKALQRTVPPEVSRIADGVHDPDARVHCWEPGGAMAAHQPSRRSRT